MDVLSSLAIIAFAALIHASFQLSVSVLTLLSGHAIGKKTAHAKLLRLTSSFVIGVSVMTLLVVSFLAYFIGQTFGYNAPVVVWAGACGLMLGLGVAVWTFYYRRQSGTSLWLPRGLARYLNDRSKATRRSAEAFSLGLTSVITELLFILAPMLIAALVLVRLDSAWQIVGLILYSLISSLSLGVVWMLIGGGHKLSGIQKWREQNKKFLQFAAGSGLIVLGFYVYVDQVMTVTAMAQAGL